MKRLSAGFTLIELLVVIAVIAILAAVLFPAFSTARETAKLSSCQSNLKQLGMGMMLYIEANGNGLPYYDNGLTKLNRRMWYDFINPFLKADKIYRCPSLMDPKIKGTMTSAYGPNNRIYGYGVPAPHLFFSYSRTTPPPKTSQIPRPSKTMLICEAYTNFDPDNPTIKVNVGFPVVYCRVTKGTDPGRHWYDYKAQYMPDGNIAGRHAEKTALLYVDGHVKSWDKKYLIQEYGNRDDCKNDDIWAHFDEVRKR